MKNRELRLFYCKYYVPNFSSWHELTNFGSDHYRTNLTQMENVITTCQSNTTLLVWIYRKDNTTPFSCRTTSTHHSWWVRSLITIICSLIHQADCTIFPTVHHFFIEEWHSLIGNNWESEMGKKWLERIWGGTNWVRDKKREMGSLGYILCKPLK